MFCRGGLAPHLGLKSEILIQELFKKLYQIGSGHSIADDVDDYLADEGIDLKKDSKGRIGFV